MNIYKTIIGLICLITLIGCGDYTNPIEIRLAIDPANSAVSDIPAETQKSFRIIKARLNACKISEAKVTMLTNNQISIKLPPIMDVEQLKRIKKLALAAGKLEFKLETDRKIVDDYADKFPKAPPGYTWYEKEEPEDSPGQGLRILVQSKAELTGESLTSARTSTLQSEGNIINFKLNPSGTKIFTDLTSHHARSVVGYEQARRLAIIFDDKLVMAPLINTPIIGGEGIITGHFTMQEANDIVAILLNGQMSRPLKIISETIPK